MRASDTRLMLGAYAALGALIPHLGTARLIDPPTGRTPIFRGPRHLPVQL
ncbi:hypothetical protein [Streptomyces sp. NPDC050564]